ncbi:MAG: rRNA maturation RNase YbeY [Thermoanaerobaculia bacterium]
MAIEVDVTGIAVPRLSRSAVAAFVRECLAAAARTERAARGIAAASVHFTDDREMALLNRRFRDRNQTTDVLTFPGESTPDGARMLGDIVISVEQARRQAVSERHALATEIRFLILHGVIHALGFDHETDDGEMNAFEAKMRGRVGLE